MEEVLIMSILCLVLLLLFREVVCWYWKINRAIGHLESIDQSLKQLVKQYSVPSATEYESLPIQGADESLTDNELIEKYSIRFQNGRYHYESYSYDRLQDAVKYAKSSREK